jgi:hypothetical protein
MKINDIWISLLTGSTVALMGCVVVAALGGFDGAWIGAAAAAVVFLISYFECLGAHRSAPGSDDVEAEAT